MNYMYMRTLCKKDMESFGAVHIRRRQLGGVKNWSKLPTDSTKNCRYGQNSEKLPPSFLDGP